MKSKAILAVVAACGTLAFCFPVRAAEVWGLPLSDALSRVTKKPFGLYVRPGKSPVSPERFRGYHTGTDFEIKTDEVKADVQVKAVCSGPLIRKNWINGYGGVAIQSCQLNGQDVTVLYGHLRYSSIKPKIHDVLDVGTSLAVLGKGYSHETSGERKHLHLSVHKGKTIDLRGYVQKQSQLSAWMDFMTIIKQ